ncbi:hypothetical protein E2C01_087271 [Portunus trituberculatus]|uniref:Uncharacterized protein n=1 Tax=Portunus trituberculatus TaxID=210409 RepID=A0A5B7JFQ7_PORTR|nr:hypothetical protein [Portunus trituberculatus]
MCGVMPVVKVGAVLLKKELKHQRKPISENAELVLNGEKRRVVGFIIWVRSRQQHTKVNGS